MGHIPYVPGPNNEMAPMPSQYTGSFPIEADYAISSSYASTSSFLLGFIASASYADLAATASYLLGSIANAISASWAILSGHSLTSDTASFAFTAATASFVLSASYSKTSTSSSYALTASYVTGLSATASYALVAGTASYSLTSITASYALTAGTASYGVFPQVIVTGSNSAVGYMYVAKANNVSSATTVDSFTSSLGNSAEWLASVGDGASFRTSQILSIWSSGGSAVNWTEVTTNTIGSSPYSFSVTSSAGQIGLILNPASGSWTVKAIRFVV